MRKSSHNHRHKWVNKSQKYIIFRADGNEGGGGTPVPVILLYFISLCVVLQCLPWGPSSVYFSIKTPTFSRLIFRLRYYIFCGASKIRKKLISPFLPFLNVIFWLWMRLEFNREHFPPPWLSPCSDDAITMMIYHAAAFQGSVKAYHETICRHINPVSHAAIDRLSSCTWHEIVIYYYIICI